MLPFLPARRWNGDEEPKAPPVIGLLAPDNRGTESRPPEPEVLPRVRVILLISRRAIVPLSARFIALPPSLYSQLSEGVCDLELNPPNCWCLKGRNLILFISLCLGGRGGG